MITEGQRVAQNEAALKEELQYLEQVVKEAKIYEILVTFKEFQQYRENYKNVIKLHDEEILMYQSLLAGTTNFLKKMRIADSLTQHLIRKEEINKLLGYPEKIIEECRLANERIAAIKEQLGLTNKETNNA